jgi:ribosome biogenesis GTPase A
MILVDTPGMMWPKIKHPSDGYLLAINHAIGKNAYDEEDIAKELGSILLSKYPDYLQSRYSIKDGELKFDAIEFLETIAKKKNLPLSKGLLDTKKVATMLINDYRNNLLGRITLESPESRHLMMKENK